MWTTPPPIAPGNRPQPHEVADFHHGTLVATSGDSMRRAWTAAALALTAMLMAGCPGNPGGDDDDGGTDGSISGRGLTFVWHANPALPIDLGGGLTITSVKLRLRNVRAIGDAAPGDARTTRSALELEWSGPEDPSPLRFGEAPPGIYQQLEAQLDDAGGGHSYEIRGRVMVGTESREYQIEDDAVVSLIMPFGPLDLLSAHEARVHVDVVVSAAVQAVDFTRVTELEEGRLVLDEDDPQLGAVRNALKVALRLRSIE